MIGCLVKPEREGDNLISRAFTRRRLSPRWSRRPPHAQKFAFRRVDNIGRRLKAAEWRPAWSLAPRSTPGSDSARRGGQMKRLFTSAGGRWLLIRTRRNTSTPSQTAERVVIVLPPRHQRSEPGRSPSGNLSLIQSHISPCHKHFANNGPVISWKACLLR